MTSRGAGLPGSAAAAAAPPRAPPGPAEPSPPARLLGDGGGFAGESGGVTEGEKSTFEEVGEFGEESDAPGPGPAASPGAPRAAPAPGAFSGRPAKASSSRLVTVLREPFSESHCRKSSSSFSFELASRATPSPRPAVPAPPPGAGGELRQAPGPLAGGGPSDRRLSQAHADGGRNNMGR